MVAADIVNAAFQVYTMLIFARVLLSWFRHNPYQPVVRFIYDLTEPFLRLFRRVIPPLGMIDISPLVALLVLSVLRQIVVSLL